eukprot:1159319-Pelagomonas_calceolata.AAC.8
MEVDGTHDTIIKFLIDDTLGVRFHLQKSQSHEAGSTTPSLWECAWECAQRESGHVSFSTIDVGRLTSANVVFFLFFLHVYAAGHWAFAIAALVSCHKTVSHRAVQATSTKPTADDGFRRTNSQALLATTLLPLQLFRQLSVSAKPYTMHANL